MIAIKAMLTREAERFSNELRENISGLRYNAVKPFLTETDGYATLVASWNGLSVGVWLDHCAGSDRPRFWVGFSSPSKTKLKALVNRLPERARPKTIIGAADYKKRGDFWSYKSGTEAELTEPYEEYWGNGESYFGLYDWGGHAGEGKMTLATYAPRKFIEEVISIETRPLPLFTRPLNDPAKRMIVELKAMEAARLYFKKRGFETKDRDQDNCGWDLDARKGKSHLKVEIKGLSGSGAIVELTPNEYAAMGIDDRADPNFRIFIVTEALSEMRRRSRVFRWIGGQWVSSTGETLSVKERLGARLTVRSPKKRSD